MAHYAHDERQVLCDLFDQVGPDAPTLCEGWRTADLAAHLVLRERRPDAALGIVVGSLSGRTERVQAQLRQRLSWEELVTSVRHGPPLLLRPFDEAMNTAEYFIHVEDVRRAAPDFEPRVLAPGLEAALWKRLKMFGRGLAKQDTARVTVEAPGYGRLVLGNGEPVTMTGSPQEVLLFVTGRGQVARLTFEGSAEAVERLKEMKLGV